LLDAVPARTALEPVNAPVEGRVVLLEAVPAKTAPGPVSAPVEGRVVALDAVPASAPVPAESAPLVACVAAVTAETLNVGEATTCCPPLNACAGIVEVIVSAAVMSYDAIAGSVIVTVVEFVRTTALTGISERLAFQPVLSDCADTRPLMMACRMLAKMMVWCETPAKAEPGPVNAPVFA
jgi:hypothetical protein